MNKGFIWVRCCDCDAQQKIERSGQSFSTTKCPRCGSGTFDMSIGQDEPSWFDPEKVISK